MYSSFLTGWYRTEVDYFHCAQDVLHDKNSTKLHTPMDENLCENLKYDVLKHKHIERIERKK